MNSKHIEITYHEFDCAELDSVRKSLYDAALAASERAYAPYSHFQVGAAALLGNGEIVTGSNQENAAYPSGLCAERVALFAACAAYPDVPVLRLAIIAQSKGEVKDSKSPCGACRQVILEVEQRSRVPMEILLCGKEKVKVMEGITSLLPFVFTSEDL